MEISFHRKPALSRGGKKKRKKRRVQRTTASQHCRPQEAAPAAAAKTAAQGAYVRTRREGIDAFLMPNRPTNVRVVYIRIVVEMLFISCTNTRVAMNELPGYNVNKRAAFTTVVGTTLITLTCDKIAHAPVSHV